MTDAFEAIVFCSKCRRPSVLDPNGRIYYREGRVWCYPVCPPARKMEVKVEICSAVEEAIANEMKRAMADMVWAMRDDDENGHIGLMLRPTRADMYPARENLKRWARNDRWKRCAGSYRR